jgi:hypothetical protein
MAAAIYLGLAVLFVLGAFRTRRRDVSLLYAVVAAFPFLIALSPKTFTTDTRYVSVVMPVFALLLAQIATTRARGGVLLALALGVSVVSLHDTVREFDPVLGTGTVTPRSIRPLLSTLERLHVDHAYADYWIAYRIDFDSNERIVAVENKFDGLVAHGGDIVPIHDPSLRYQPYEDEVRRGLPGFVFFRSTLPSPAFLATLKQYHYKRHAAQSFVVYARTATR